MKAERRKVRLNNKHPKEDASTFTQTRQKRLFFLIFFCPFPFFSSWSTNPSPLLSFSLCAYLHLLTLFSCALSSPLCFFPSLYLPKGNSFGSRHFCLSFSLLQLQTVPTFRSCRCAWSIGDCAVSGVRLPACPWWHSLPFSHLAAFN